MPRLRMKGIFTLSAWKKEEAERWRSLRIPSGVVFYRYGLFVCVLLVFQPGASVALRFKEGRKTADGLKNR